MSDSIQLLQSLKASLEKASQTTDVSLQQTLLACSAVVANELILRCDVGAAHKRLQQGLALLDEAATLAPTLSKNEAFTIAVKQARLGDHAAYDVIIDQVLLVQRGLSAAVSALTGEESAGSASLLARIVDWEAAQHERQTQQAPSVANAAALLPDPTAEQFQAYLRQRFANPALSVSEFKVVVGGFSKLTVLVKLEGEVEGCNSLVIRAMREKPLMDLPLDTVIEEYPVVKAAWELGSKAPRPLWLEDDSYKMGRQFMITERAFGRNMGAADGSCEALSEAAQRSLAREMVKIHQIDLKEFTDRVNPSVLGGWREGETLAENTQEFVRFWAGVMTPEQRLHSPLLERGLCWLAANVEPSKTSPVLVHGDYGLHNILIDNDDVSVVLDWELCHIGDPAEEISWFLANTDSVVDKGTFLSYYYEYGGQKISEFRLRYFAVAHCIRMAIACSAAQLAVRNGSDNIQLAMFGLRFMHHHSGRLNRMIAEAEAVKGDW